MELGAEYNRKYKAFKIIIDEELKDNEFHNNKDSKKSWNILKVSIKNKTSMSLSLSSELNISKETESKLKELFDEI